MARVLQSDKTVYKMYLPCLSYDAFDRTGQYPIWMLARLFEMVRGEAFRKSNFSNNNILMKLFSASLVVADYTVSKSWYKKTKNGNMKVELVFTLYLVHIGRSSSHLLTTMQDAETGEEYGLALLKMVYINRQTRKAKALPDMDIDLSENLQLLSSKQSSVLECLKKIPMKAYSHSEPQDSGMFRYHVRIKPSFIDRNNHTNNTQYLRFCMDCAAMAVNSGHLKDFKGDIALYNVHKGKMLYSRETVLGDELDVLTWPSKDAELELCFLIKRTEDVIFSCTFSFHPLPVPSSKY